MRFHDRFSLYDLRYSDESYRRFVAESSLIAARLEPTLSARYEAVLDLVFSDGTRMLPLGFVLIEGAMLVERESSPFLWPVAMRGRVADADLQALERRIEPWLQSLVLARFENAPQERRFTGDAASLDLLARAAQSRVLGVTPYAQYLLEIAPAVYASRFTNGRTAATRTLPGAAYLCGRADAVAVDVDDASYALLESWYGALRFERYDAKRRYAIGLDAIEADAVTIGAHGERIVVSRPLPMATLVSFDPGDSVEASSFHVAVAADAPLRESSIVQPAPVGGSGGTVALIVRDDWERTPDADTDTVLALAARLSGEGFTVRVHNASAPLHPSTIDLAHVVGKDHAPVLAHILAHLKAAAVPVVVQPLLDDPAGEGVWGSGVTPFAYRGSTDLSTLELYLDGLARRRLVADNAPPPPTTAGPFYDPAVQAMLASATVVIASTPEEEQLLRSAYRYDGSVVVATPLVAPGQARAADALGGIDEFVLVHGPLDARSGTVGAVRAARETGLPVLFTGPVANAEIHAFFVSYLGGRCWYVPPVYLDAASEAGLYARARVFVDVAWLGRGLSRSIRAASYGAALVGANGSFVRSLFPDAILADPADEADIARAIRQAWTQGSSPERAVRAAGVADPAAAFQGVVRAYDEASRSLSLS